jgi:hypothetical protein
VIIRVSCVARTVHARGLFIAVALGCSAPARPVEPVTQIAVVPADAAQVTPEVVALGARCSRDQPCTAAAHCLPLYRGYCARACNVACDEGTCVETTHHGEQCMARCTSDADCRIDDGHVCDLVWRACMPPNTAAIAPRDCGPPAGLGRDPKFQPPTSIADASQPAAVIASDGTALVLMRSEASLALAQLDAANRVTSARVPGSEGAEHPRLARGRGDVLYASWLAPTGVMFARSRDRGATWSTPIAIHEPADCEGEASRCPAYPALVAGTHPDRREVVYVAYAAHGLRVRASRDAGETWTPPVTALVGARGDLAVGGDGTLYAIALEGSELGAYGSANQRIDVTLSIDGARSFARPRRLSPSGETLPYFFASPRLVVDDRRRWLYAAYTRGTRDARWDVVLAASKDRGASWTRTRLGDDPPCAVHLVPSLATDPTTGILHAAWYDSRGPRFAHATCGPGLVRCQQVGRINADPLPPLSLFPGSPRAIPPHPALALDGARRILHAVWMQPPQVMHARARP